MKNIKIAIITTVLLLATSGSLLASPPGKHAVEKIPHRHGAAQGSAQSVVKHTMLKRIGPPGKGLVHSRTHRR